MVHSRAFDKTLEVVAHPLESDVLCGKNKECLEHPGSKAFRDVIEQYVTKYQAADSKYMKMEITKTIYSDLTARSARFLKKISKTGDWEELSSSSVRDKIGHALRFANKRRSKRAKQTASNTRMPTHKRGSSEISHSSTDSSYSDSSDSVVPLDPVQAMTRTSILPSDGSTSESTSQSDGHFRPVTKILERLSTQLPLSRLPRSVSFSDTVGMPELQAPTDNKKLSDTEVLNILREPLMDFEPKSVAPVYQI